MVKRMDTGLFTIFEGFMVNKNICNPLCDHTLILGESKAAFRREHHIFSPLFSMTITELGILNTRYENEVYSFCMNSVILRNKNMIPLRDLVS